MIPTSKYLPYFVENNDRLKEEIELVGDVILVERMKFPEKKVGSLFIADAKKVMVGAYTSEAPEFYRVLMVGKGYYDSDSGKDIPLDINQGDVIHTGAASIRLWSSFPLLEVSDSDVLGITRHVDILMRWKDEAKFVDFLQQFNASVKSRNNAT